ncbi:MAG TPA: ABC transporter substrate-binding protein [Chloroflexota bacterium]
MKVPYIVAAVVAIAATACSPQPSGSANQPSTVTSANAARTLVIAVDLEPTTLVGRGLDLFIRGATPVAPTQLFHAGLTQVGTKQTPDPLLAETIPQLATDSWKVFPDGRMETTWHLRPNLKWHDGTSLVADDVVLSVQVRIAQKTPGTGEGGGGISLAGLIEDVIASDPSTVVVRWRSSSPAAGVSDWQPLPHHILGAAFDGVTVSDAYQNLSYWTTDFVGLGPYRLQRWEPGAFIEGVAFPGYVRGQPQIQHVKVVWITDPNVALASLRSAAIDIAVDGTIVFEQATALKREWAGATEGGSVLLSPGNVRFVEPQFKPEYVNPKALQDLRVRQALAYAIDKQALVDTMLEGEPGAADSGVSPSSPAYADLDRVVTKYPLDPQRSGQLLAEAGFTRDADGLYSQSGTRFRPELMAFRNGIGEREALILADGWKRAGIDTPLRIVSATEALDAELVVTYPGLRDDSFPIDAGYPQFPTSAIGTAANKWVGANRNGFSDPEFDRLYKIIQTSLDSSEVVRAQVQAMKLLSEQAAYFPLYFSYRAIAHTASLVGPEVAASKTPLYAIERWHWK